MTGILKSPWSRLLGLAVAGGMAFYFHSHAVKDAYEAGKQVAGEHSVASIDTFLKQIITATQDINQDGLEDFCLTFPPGSDDPRPKVVCHFDYDGDCIQDVVYAFLGPKGMLEIVNSTKGKVSPGQCTSRNNFGINY